MFSGQNLGFTIGCFTVAACLIAALSIIALICKHPRIQRTTHQVSTHFENYHRCNPDRSAFLTPRPVEQPAWPEPVIYAHPQTPAPERRPKQRTRGNTPATPYPQTPTPAPAPAPVPEPAVFQPIKHWSMN